jgi:hypothetical protein
VSEKLVLVVLQVLLGLKVLEDRAVQRENKEILDVEGVEVIQDREALILR